MDSQDTGKSTLRPLLLRPSSIMSRPAMRLLSSRLRFLRPLSSVPAVSISRNARCASRYSNPSARPIAAVQSFTAPAFTQEGAHKGDEDVSHDPYDATSARDEMLEKRAYHLRRMRFAGIGLMLSVAGLTALLYNLDLDDIEKAGNKALTKLDASTESKEKFYGREVHIIGAGEDKRILAQGDPETELVETGTSSVPFFPRLIYLPSSSSSDPAANVVAAPNTQANPGNVLNEEEYTLLGQGIRTVSIFSIQVYVMGLYIRTKDISTLQSHLIHLINAQASTLVPSEKDELRRRLLDPTESTEIWEKLLRTTNVKSAWRIVPTRNTDFAHLRDGWITGIKRGTQEAAAVLRAKASGPAETEYENESFGDAVKNFKDMFTGGGRAPKGSVVMLVRDGAGALDIMFQEGSKTQGLEKMGRMEDARISRLVWMGYLAGKNVSSEAARKGVVDGCINISARPVGSVETMVK